MDTQSIEPQSTLPTRLTETMKTLRSHLPELTQQYKVKSLGVFGSHVRYEAERDSDLDILVEFHEPPTLFEFVRLQRTLADIVGMDVDLVMKSGLKPTIGKRILAEVIQL